MTWSYDPALATDKDKVRFKTADTDPSAPFLSDEEIAFLLTEAGSLPRAVLAAAEEILSRFARQVDKTIGPAQLAASQRHRQYMATVARLRRELRKMAVPYAGGISVGDKESRAADTDRVEPAFSRTMQAFESDPLHGADALPGGAV